MQSLNIFQDEKQAIRRSNSVFVVAVTNVTWRLASFEAARLGDETCQQCLQLATFGHQATSNLLCTFLSLTKTQRPPFLSTCILQCCQPLLKVIPFILSVIFINPVLSCYGSCCCQSNWYSVPFLSPSPFR